MAERRRRRRRYNRLRQRYRNRPSKRIIRDRLNPLENYTNDALFEGYRFRQATIVYLSGMIGRNLLDSTKNKALPPMLQIFAYRRVFATGAYHKLIVTVSTYSSAPLGEAVDP